MRHTALVCIAILVIAIAGCSSTDTTTPDFTLNAVVQGNWLVETMDASKDWETLGTLTIDGNSYHSNSVHDGENLSDLQDQLCFLDQPAGKLVLEYQSKISPDDDIRSLDNNDILLKIAIGCGETFLVRADQDGKEYSG